jgi:hypothetical protein
MRGGYFRGSDKPSSGMSPIYFLLLEALRLKNKLLHEKLCHVLTNPLEVMRNLEEISALNWIREHKLGKFLATEEAQCIFFISNSLRVGVAGESSEDILFLNHHLHGFGPMKKSVTYMSAVSMVMKNYVEYRRSDAMSSRLELARQLLEVKQKQKWVELVKNSGARKVLEAMYIKLVACEQIIGLESEFIDQLRSLVYFMAELFEEICCHGTIEDDIESFFCIRDLARLLIFEFCWEESRGNAFLLQIKDDRSFASKFVFFSWCNELHNRSAEILLKSFSPHFFAARDFCMLNHMLTDVFFHADKISCDVLSSWMDDFALHAKNNPRSIVIDPVILGVVKFLHKEKSIPRWLNFYGLQYLIPHLKKSIKDGCEVSCKLEAFLQDFERKNSARQILQRKYKYTRTVKSRNPSRKGFGFKSQVSS